MLPFSTYYAGRMINELIYTDNKGYCWSEKSHTTNRHSLVQVMSNLFSSPVFSRLKFHIKNLNIQITQLLVKIKKKLLFTIKMDKYFT